MQVIGQLLFLGLMLLFIFTGHNEWAVFFAIFFVLSCFCDD